MQANNICRPSVSIVGAGPGDMELVTKKAMKCIQEADVIVYDNLIDISLLNYASLNTELIYAGKEAANHYLSQGSIIELLMDKAREGKYVVRLKGGDPYLFGRGSEEALALKEAGISYEIVSGVTSSIAVPAYAGIPVTDRRFVSSCHIITAHREDEAGIDFENISKLEGTLVFMMGLAKLHHIVQGLTLHGKASDTPVAVLSDGSRYNRRKCVGTLADIEEKVKEAKLLPPAIIVVGEVVSLSNELDNFLERYSDKKLFRKKILLTGTRYICNKIKVALADEGCDIDEISIIESVPIESDFYNNIEKYIESHDYLVFSSANGIRVFFEKLKELHNVDLRKLSNIKFAVIGKGSAQTLRNYGYIADFVPSSFSNKDLAVELCKQLKGEKLLLLRAREASAELVEELEANKVEYTDVPLYETFRDYRRTFDIKRLIKNYDYVVVASSITAHTLCEMVEDKALLEGRVVSIGPVTTGTCKRLGVEPLMSAREYSVDGIVRVLLQ